MGALAKIFSWLLKKLTFGILLAIAGVASLGLWVFLRDRVDFDLRRLEVVRALTGETARVRAALGDVEARLAKLTVAIGAQEERAREADRLARELAALNSGLSRLTSSAEQVRENEARIVRLRELEQQARQEVAALTETRTRTQWERDGLQVALGRLDGEIRRVEAEKSKVLHYAREAWERYGRHILLAVVVYFLGPPLVRLAGYYGFAPLLARRPPLRFGRAEAWPDVRTSRAALEVPLEPGDTLWVKEKFLQASDEGLLKRTRLLLDWRMPVACLSTGLVELIEMRNAAPQAVQRVTFSSQDDPHVELAQVVVPAGGSLILRPRFLAGLVGPVGGRLLIRRHWRLFHLQSWITGQFRHFEFVGPCRLLIAGSRGVRAEVLEAREDGSVSARRVNRGATIGFSAGLGYRPVRAETYWAYLRGQNPLFDDLFEGEGVFLCQETTARNPSEREPGFGAKLWDAWLRLLGV